jgi:hypothetical protein
MTEWQEISTAPKDGRTVLIRDEDEAICEEAWWDGFMWGNEDSVFTKATHWAPVARSQPIPDKRGE